MIEFKEYEAKPIKRKALQIHKSIGNLMFLGQDNWNYEVFDPTSSAPHLNINFKAHQTVERGDWIVYLNDDDVYHCTDKVFRERNIVPD